MECYPLVAGPRVTKLTTTFDPAHDNVICVESIDSIPKPPNHVTVFDLDEHYTTLSYDYVGNNKISGLKVIEGDDRVVYNIGDYCVRTIDKYDFDCIREEIEMLKKSKLNRYQGRCKAGNVLIVDGDGMVKPSEPTDIASTWGKIVGNINQQTDLKERLDDKVNIPQGTAHAGQVMKVNSYGDVDTGFVNWGEIGGSLNTQTDLVSEFNAVDSKLSQKVNSQYPATEAGKFLYVNNMGTVVPMAVPSTDTIWGNITGNINDQSDLKNKLDSKIDINQGAIHAGEVLKVGADGAVRPSAGAASTFGELGGNPRDNIRLAAELDAKQDTLYSGSNIKTIAGQSVLGSGDITVPLAHHASTHEFGGSDQLHLDGSQISSGVIPTTQIPYLDASKINSGVFSIDRIPQAAIARVVTVPNDSARFALTPADVSKGDSVYVTATQKLYMVINTSQLSTEAGYLAYVANVDWVTISNKPATYPSDFSTLGGVVASNAPLVTMFNTKVDKAQAATDINKSLIVDSTGNLSPAFVNYTYVNNKPNINSVEVIGNKTGTDLGLVDRVWTSTEENYILKVIAESGKYVVKPVPSAGTTCAFFDLTGSPYDNLNLKGALDNKVNLTQGTAESGKFLYVGADGKVATKNLDPTSWGSIVGTLTDQVDLATELNKRIQYEAGSATTNFTFGTEVDGRLYVVI